MIWVNDLTGEANLLNSRLPRKLRRLGITRITDTGQVCFGSIMKKGEVLSRFGLFCTSGQSIVPNNVVYSEIEADNTQQILTIQPERPRNRYEMIVGLRVEDILNNVSYTIKFR